MVESVASSPTKALSVWAFHSAAGRSSGNLVELLVMHWGSRSPPELTEPEWHQYLAALVQAGQRREASRMIPCSRS